jgi:hypothetical protein
MRPDLYGSCTDAQARLGPDAQARLGPDAEARLVRDEARTCAMSWAEENADMMGAWHNQAC